MSSERFEIVEPILRGVAPTLPAAASKILKLSDLRRSESVPYWIIRDSATGAAYVVTPERIREILASDGPASRDATREDPFPLVEETADPAELPTVAEWLGAGAPLREVEPGPETGP